MSGISQNTKNLTINQLKRLIENNGVLQGSAYQKALKANKPVEYCMESLKESLFDKQSKASDSYMASQQARDDQFSAYASAIPINKLKEKEQYTKDMANMAKKDCEKNNHYLELTIIQNRINYGAALARREVLASEALFKTSLILTAAGFAAAYLMIGA